MFLLVDMSTRFCSPNQKLRYYPGSTIWLSWKFPQTSAPQFRMIPMSLPCSHRVYTKQRVLVEPRPWLTHGNFHTSTSTCPGSSGPILVRKGFKARSEERNAEENLWVWEMTMRVVMSKKRINFMVRVTDSKPWEENYLLRKTKCFRWFGSRDIRLLLMSAKK